MKFNWFKKKVKATEEFVEEKQNNEFTKCIQEAHTEDGLEKVKQSEEYAHMMELNQKLIDMDKPSAPKPCDKYEKVLDEMNCELTNIRSLLEEILKK